MSATTCVHFTGLWGHGMKKHLLCSAGVAYEDVKDSSQKGPYCWPCLPGIGGRTATTTCQKKRLPTVEELAADKRELEEFLAKIDAGKSPCCDAPLDESRVREGTGPRHCSKCGEFVFRACARIGASA